MVCYVSSPITWGATERRLYFSCTYGMITALNEEDVLISPASPLCPDSDLIDALLWPALFQVNLVHYLSSLIRDNYTLSRNGEPPVT